MNRLHLQNLAKLRVKDAKVLIDNNRFEGAYYLLGYAIECALKACIAKQTKRYDFPERKAVSDSHTHELEKLLGLANLKLELERRFSTNRTFEQNWAVVKDWKAHFRYSTTITKIQAKDFYSAVTSRKYGILPWIKNYW